MEGGDSRAIKSSEISLQTVRPDQVLARVVQDKGKPGRDIFGREVLPAAPPEGTLQSGEHVALAEDRQSCTAEIYGYAGVLDEVITVISPIYISKDNMAAFFVDLPHLGEYQVPAVADIQALLEYLYIEYGIDDEAIATLCNNLQKRVPVERVTPIAQGTQPKKGKGITYKILFDPPMTRYFGQIKQLFRRSLSVERLVYDLQGLACKVAAAGEPLAIQQPVTQGKVGYDVYGEEVLFAAAEDQELEIDGNVVLSEDGKTYLSEIYGYVGVEKNQVSMLSPIWVSKDRMTAYFIHLLQLGEKRTPSFEEVQQLLERASVQYGIDYGAIEILCKKIEHDLPVGLVVPLAKGQAAQPGEDGRIEFSVDIEQKPGVIQEDGSIDFKQLNLTPPVKADQRIGTRIPAAEGTRGTDVLGREIPADDGQEVQVKLGKNVRLERKEGHPDQYYAESDGGLAVLRQTAHTKSELRQAIHWAVYPERIVQGDLDYTTGDVDHPGNVHVTGSVKAGFNVKAAGSVIIEGHVENNVSILCGGDVAVQGGITGRGTRIQTEGSVHTHFWQIHNPLNASMLACSGWVISKLRYKAPRR